MSQPATNPAPGSDAGPGLRDLFAAHLIAATIIAPKQVGVPRPDMDEMSRQAYKFADAMLRARDA